MGKTMDAATAEWTVVQRVDLRVVSMAVPAKQTKNQKQIFRTNRQFNVSREEIQSICLTCEEG